MGLYRFYAGYDLYLEFRGEVLKWQICTSSRPCMGIWVLLSGVGVKFVLQNCTDMWWSGGSVGWSWCIWGTVLRPAYRGGSGGPIRPGGRGGNRGIFGTVEMAAPSTAAEIGALLPRWKRREAAIRPFYRGDAGPTAAVAAGVQLTPPAAGWRGGTSESTAAEQAWQQSTRPAASPPPLRGTR